MKATCEQLLRSLGSASSAADSANGGKFSLEFQCLLCVQEGLVGLVLCGQFEVWISNRTQ